MSRLDPHSYTEDNHAQVVRLIWNARVDFDARALFAEATLELDGPARGGALDLDTRGLAIEAVSDDAGRAVPFELGGEEKILGSRLSLNLAAGTRKVTIRYRTEGESSALQWLTPEQTAGGAHPYLFSQCQAIHARSVVPLQDTPSRRITFEATLTVPRALRGLMAAGFVGREERDEVAIERWSMPQAIAPYLLAFAVGDLASRDVGAGTRVWAEPAVVDIARKEFSEVDKLLDAGERLFGPYAWERFDILVMPPSFPYGGMENPRLTFVTPTLLAGDKSQVRVIAHELAHAWTGNLVTNANAEHFWLNEGWTRYAELRITEEVEGRESAALLAALCRIDLDQAVAKFVSEGRGELTRLRTHLEGVDPDDVFSVVPYDKGELFLRAIERQVGRERFDRFAKRYLDRFRFGAVTTEQFIALVEEELPSVLAEVGAPAWLDGEGVPEGAPSTPSRKLDAVVAVSADPDKVDPAWSATELTLWLERAPRPLPVEACQKLDARLGLSKTGNAEVKVAWLKLAIVSHYDAVLPEVEAMLEKVGRLKYLIPLYGALLDRVELRDFARTVFERAKDAYHPIAKMVVGARFGKP